MSFEDVYPDDMNGPSDFDHTMAEALLRGSGGDVDPHLAHLLGEVRAAYAAVPPAIGTELSVLLRTGAPPRARSILARSFEKLRSSVVAKVGAGAAAAVVATGGLAAAGALPAPVRDAVSHLGITTPSHHGPSSPPTGASSTTTGTHATGDTGDSTPGAEAGNARAGQSPSPGDTDETTPTTAEPDDPPATLAPGETDDTGGTGDITPTTAEPDDPPTATSPTDNTGETTPTTAEPDGVAAQTGDG